MFPERISGKLFVEPTGREELFGGREKWKVDAAIEELRDDEPIIDAGSGLTIEDDASSIRSGMSSIGRMRAKKLDAAGTILDGIAG